MRFCFFLIPVILSLTSTSISAHFFPNISSIPPSLLPNGTVTAWESFQKLAGCQSGDKVEGLAKLKQYFNHFGYISNSSSTNFTDDFDEALESAIKTYQRNFNLDTTGQMDDATLKQIVLPRCGVADIINGSTTMNSGKTSNTNGNVHTVAHYTFFPGTPFWPSDKRDLTYAFLPDNQLSASIKEVFARAFDRWSTVTTLTFTVTESFGSADIKIGFFKGDHGDGEPFDGVLGTLAHAFSPPSGRLHLDLDENWVISGDISTSSTTTAVDLESVAVHEIGHLLGLGHSSVEGAIMYPTISSGTKRVELASDDIQGIQVLYGGNPNYTGLPTTESQERDTSGAYAAVPRWWLRSLVAVGLVAIRHVF